MREAARTYRLVVAPSSTTQQPPPSRVGAAGDERQLQSGVEEIHAAVEFALSVLRRSLRLNSVVLLLLDSSGQKLEVEEISSSDDTIQPGPFGAGDGLFGAVITQRSPVALVGSKARRNTPYYGIDPGIQAVCATPLLEHGHVRGVLMADRLDAEAFTKDEMEALQASTHFIARAIENERVFVQLERTKMVLGKLYRAVESLAGTTTEAAVIEAGVNAARELAPIDFAAVTLFDKTCLEHEVCAASGEGSEHLLGARFRHNSGLVSMVVANRQALPYRGGYDPQRQVVFTRKLTPPSMPSLLVLPFLVHDRVLGTLVLGSQRRAAFNESVRPTLEVLASHVAVSLDNARMVKRLGELATTDGLTGLFNKRSLIETAGQKLKSALRFRKPLSVLVTDIDHFKKVNDNHGHDVGDVVIKGLADILKRVKRETDIVGRFGGEEFVVVCEETDARGAALLADRIRQELSATKFPHRDGFSQRHGLYRSFDLPSRWKRVGNALQGGGRSGLRLEAQRTQPNHRVVTRSRPGCSRGAGQDGAVSAFTLPHRLTRSPEQVRARRPGTQALASPRA